MMRGLPRSEEILSGWWSFGSFATGYKLELPLPASGPSGRLGEARRIPPEIRGHSFNKTSVRDGLPQKGSWVPSCTANPMDKKLTAMAQVEVLENSGKETRTGISLNSFSGLRFLKKATISGISPRELKVFRRLI
jgi:hypothetical protein